MKKNDYYEDDDAYDFTESLKKQVNEHLEEERFERDSYRTEGTRRNQKLSDSKQKRGTKNVSGKRRRKKKKSHRGLKIFVTMLATLLFALLFLVGTKYGRKLLYKAAGGYIYNYVNKDETKEEHLVDIEGDVEFQNRSVVGRKEDYVSNFLLFGIEEIGGGKNTDSMIIVSINTKTKNMKLTSLMRDTYVTVPGWKSTKLNSAYAHGGINMLVDTIEQNYKIHIDGYANVNFDSFEKIIDRLGGVTIELGKEEADYLNRTNYISKKKYRNVEEGVNKLNGNQALGYCRVRKVPTLGGANYDFGRTLRQRRVIDAIFDSYISQGIFQWIPIMNDCMGYVTTSLSKEQIETALEDIVENKITTLDMMRVPVDGMYDAPRAYQGVTWPLVLDWDSNIAQMYEFIYGDTQEEANAKVASYR